MVNEEQVWDVLKKVFDPELNFSVVDLGLIYKVGVGRRVNNVQDVRIEMTMTTPFCPYGPALLDEMKQQLRKIEGLGEINIEVVWEPPWDVNKIKPEIREQLGIV
ncbi:MAG: metal-sulfur cluster assembly factor [Patescibacteria group bacterium]|nr:metal-sulfur cluster assembly factor [Patescibacteria group bacterium]